MLVLRTARDWVRAGERVLLATVARTWGSSPRPVGSMMALRGDGRVVGSVSGGCIEDDLIHRYTTAGIYIGSKTPAEIAVSVMVEVLAIKNAVKLPREVSVSKAKRLKERQAPVA